MCLLLSTRLSSICFKNEYLSRECASSHVPVDWSDGPCCGDPGKGGADGRLFLLECDFCLSAPASAVPVSLSSWDPRSLSYPHLCTRTGQIFNFMKQAFTIFFNNCSYWKDLTVCVCMQVSVHDSETTDGWFNLSHVLCWVVSDVGCVRRLQAAE